MAIVNTGRSYFKSALCTATRISFLTVASLVSLAAASVASTAVVGKKTIFSSVFKHSEVD